MHNRPKITSVVLAGGRGSRMGGLDKGLIHLQGRPLIEHILQTLAPQVDQVLLNANRNHAEYQQYGFPVISDTLSNFQGPLAGILVAMQQATTDYILTVPCDAPYIAPDLVDRLWSALQREQADLAVAYDGQRLQPVHALLPTRLAADLQTFLSRNERSIVHWYQHHRLALADCSDCTSMFANMNTPEQQSQLEQTLRQTPTQASPRLIGFCAWSNTGKTTLIEQVIPLLKTAGLQIAVIKHGHHSVEFDKPGKDTYRFREAGADQVILATNRRIALMTDCPHQPDPALADALKLINTSCADLIIVEGFKHETYPKIEVHRPSLGKSVLYPHDTSIVAVASDAPLNLPAHLALLDLNQPQQIAAFILSYFHLQPSKTPAMSHLIQTAPSCADAQDPTSLNVQQALERILTELQPLQATLKRPLRDALGYALAGDLIAPFNVPNHANSAMDGYALRADDLPTEHTRSYRLLGTTLAGQRFQGECAQGECIRIMTGAPMPTGTDTVIMQEHTELDSEKAEPQVRIGLGHRAGQNVRQAGEDIAQGSIVLKAGRSITPADLGLMASLGLGEITVRRRLRVAFFSTGDELRSIGEPIQDGQVYDSNRYTLYGLLSQLNVEILDLGVVQDDPALLETALLQAADIADVVITSGGVSVGEADYIKGVLTKLGHIHFWKLAIKPGRPLAFGQLGKAHFFGLPGNPVAVMVTFLQFVQPALLKLAGYTDYQPLLIDAKTQSRIKKQAGRTEFQRGIVSRNARGELVVTTTGYQGSGVLSSMSQANGLIVLPEQRETVEIGETVQVQLFNWVL